MKGGVAGFVKRSCTHVSLMKKSCHLPVVRPSSVTKGVRVSIGLGAYLALMYPKSCKSRA